MKDPNLHNPHLEFNLIGSVLRCWSGQKPALIGLRSIGPTWVLCIVRKCLKVGSVKTPSNMVPPFDFGLDEWESVELMVMTSTKVISTVY